MLTLYLRAGHMLLQKHAKKHCGVIKERIMHGMTTTIVLVCAAVVPVAVMATVTGPVTACVAPWPCLNTDVVNATGFRAPATVVSCDTSGATDYFPDKVMPDYSQQWNVTYHNWYKILTNTRVNQSFILYQRGCPQPTIALAATAPLIPVPVNSVEITSSTYETFLTIIGERLSIVVSSAMGGVFSVDPCMQAQFLSGHTSDQSCAGNCYGSTCVKQPEIAYINRWSSGRCPAASLANVTVDEVSETTLLPQVEWIEWFSVWFNKEGAVSTYVSDLDAHITCLTDTIEQQRQALGIPKPKVLWATPPASLPVGPGSNWGSIGVCPNYYCEAVQLAGGIMLNNDSMVAALAPQWPNPGPNASTLFATAAGQADVILVPSPLWSGSYLSSAECDTIYSSSDVLPPSVPAVANQNVWDTGRIRDPLGGLDWFVSRLATPEVLIESIAQILYPQMRIRSASLGNAWWQNVYTEAACNPPGGNPSVLNLVESCTNVSEATVPSRGFVCPSMTTSAPTPAAAASAGSDDDDGLSTLNIVLIVVVIVAVLGVAVFGVQYMRKRQEVAALQSDQEAVLFGNEVYEGEEMEGQKSSRKTAAV